MEALPETLARLVTEKADGNALFAEEIVSFLIDRGVLRATGEKVEFDVSAVAAALTASVQNQLRRAWTDLVQRIARSSKQHR